MFSRPVLADLIARTRADVQSRLPRDETLRWDDAEVYARVQAGAADALYGYLDWLARQIIYDTAETEILERWANIWGVTRKIASNATGTATFTGSNGAAIAAGLTLTAYDGTEYETTDAAVIASGTATVPIAASVAAAAGNRLAGEILTLVTPQAGANATATAGELSGGADLESDEALRARFLDRIRTQPQGGSAADYVRWALEVSGVTRAWAYPLELGPGTVTVRFVRDDDASLLPDAGEVATVQAYIDTFRPVTAAVTVVAPTSTAQAFTITAPTGLTIDQKTIIEDELAALLLTVAPGGKLYTEEANQIITATSGQFAHFITSPASDVTYSTGQIPVMGVVTWL